MAREHLHHCQGVGAAMDPSMREANDKVVKMVIQCVAKCQAPRGCRAQSDILTLGHHGVSLKTTPQPGAAKPVQFGLFR